MRKLICLDCDEIFDEEDADTVREWVGEFWGAPAYKNYNACPVCHSIEVTECYVSDDEEEDDTE